MSYVLSYDQQDFLQDGGVSDFYPQDGGVENLPTRWRQCRVFDSFTHKMAVWETCLQDGGVSEGFAYEMSVWEFCPQDGGDKQNVNKNNVEYILRDLLSLDIFQLSRDRDSESSVIR